MATIGYKRGMSEQKWTNTKVKPSPKRGVRSVMNIASLNLRQAIMYKMQGSNANAVEETITDAIQSGQEKTLPGLGVLFEVLWQNSDQASRREMVETIAQHLPEQANPPV